MVGYQAHYQPGGPRDAQGNGLEFSSRKPHSTVGGSGLRVGNASCRLIPTPFVAATELVALTGHSAAVFVNRPLYTVPDVELVLLTAR
jgi:hypothetical protein